MPSDFKWSTVCRANRNLDNIFKYVREDNRTTGQAIKSLLIKNNKAEANQG